MGAERLTVEAARRTVVVTGASRGIGEAVARRLADVGMRVVLMARSAERLKELANDIGRDAIAIACDLSDNRDVDRAGEDVENALGHSPDILVNNAGAFEIAPAHEQDPDAFAQILDVNLASPFRLVRRWLPDMLNRGNGHIVTIGSIADRVIFPGNAAYAASKFGARALHEVLREELRGTGVRASLVSPAQVDTELWNPFDPDNAPGFTPRASMLTPAAVADAVAYVLNAPGNVNVDELRLSRS
jgi:NADP-dependent 3-hydroxy acid dehydrogenase YdfG